MAGAKGRSGGARPGAGRKRVRPPDPPPIRESADGSLPAIMDGAQRDPLDFLLSMQNDPLVDPRLRLRAAIAAAQYKHTKRGDGGKKEEAATLAEQAGKGRFAPKAPPKLIVNNRG